MPKTFFTSDLHFGHKNILKFNPDTRQYADVEEMDQAIIANWQSLVGPEDHVWSLGDMFFSKEDRAIAIMEQLPGIKHLIWGNHDQVIQRSSRLRGFFATIDYYKEISFGRQDLVMLHYPIQEWNKMHRGAYHAFGHVHGKIVPEGRAVDVGWDGILGTSLIEWCEIDAYLDPRPIMTHHGNGLPNEQIIGKTK